MIEKPRVPDIYIIGAQKSGTTTLYDWLSQHPQIYGHPLAKDYPFFSSNQTFKEGLSQFSSFSKKAPKDILVLGGDANAMFDLIAIERMRNIIPSARLIAILRNPVDRAYSAYTHAIERLMEYRTFEEAINEELQGIAYDENSTLQRDYLRHGHYAQQLLEVYRHFPKEHVKIVFFENLKADPTTELKAIFEFLGITNDFIPNLNIRNETKGSHRSKWLTKLTYAKPSSEKLRKLGKLLVPFSVRTLIRQKLAEFNRIEAPKPEFPDNVRSLLQEYYKKEITALESLLDKEINIWRTN